MQIKTSFKAPKIFSFKCFNVEDVKREINNTNSKTATPKLQLHYYQGNLKWKYGITALVLTECFDQNIKNSTFSNRLKNDDVSSVRKYVSPLLWEKNYHHDKLNYRTDSILTLWSKHFEYSLYEQINSHSKHIFSEYQ